MRYDVIVAGAGPGGSAAATFLAKAGHQVLVLEKALFPRPHIGESLLPVGVGVLKRLGIPTPGHVFQYKRGAQFICEDTGQILHVSFEEALPGPPRHAWQVDRAQFDTLLRDQARQAGVHVEHGALVTAVSADAHHVKVSTPSKDYTARYFIDATGQGRLMAKLNRSVEPIRDFGLAAAYQHFDSVPIHRLGEDGDIRIMMRPEGWAWAIPLPNDRLSIGLVTRQKGATPALVEEMVRSSPLLQKWTYNSQCTPPHLVGNYSFRNARPAGIRYSCVGDAACFLDPVFSSGVSLALVSAELTAKHLAQALNTHSEAQPDLMYPVSNHMKRAYGAFTAFIQRFYHAKMVENLFFPSSENEAFRQGVVSILAGDVWRNDNPFQDMLERARRLRTRPQTYIAPATV